MAVQATTQVVGVEVAAREGEQGPQGVLMRLVNAGDALHFPAEGQTARIHYEGRLEDGRDFDSSRKRGRAFEFRIGGGAVIPGLDEAVLQMSRGQRAMVTIPPHLAYGAIGYPPVIPPSATLIFDIELLSFSAK